MLDPFKSTIGDWSDARLLLWKGHIEEWYYQTVIARFILSGGKLIEFKLFPVDSRYSAPRADRGRPMLADKAMAKKIIERYQRLSAPFGTEILIQGWCWRSEAVEEEPSIFETIVAKLKISVVLLE